MDDALVRSVVLKRDEIDDFDVCPFSIPAIRELDGVALDPHVTLFAGENGMGKSTLVEAIAVAAGFDPEGSSRHMTVSTRPSRSVLHRHPRLVRGSRRPRTGYFLPARLSFLRSERGAGGAPMQEALERLDALMNRLIEADQTGEGMEPLAAARELGDIRQLLAEAPAVLPRAAGGEPHWRCERCGTIVHGATRPERCSKCGHDQLFKADIEVPG